MTGWTPNPGQERALTETLKSGRRYCLIYGGSRSGKTALFTKSILDRALIAPGSRHLIVRKEANAARRSIVKDTLPAVWAMTQASTNAPPPKFNGEYGYFDLANGSQIWVGGLSDEKAMERILGNEYVTIYANEASEIIYEAVPLLRSRLAQTVDNLRGDPLPQRFYVDLNPTNRAHWTYRMWIDGVDPEDQTAIDRTQYAVSTINPMDNAANLDGDYIADLSSLPERQRKRFFLGEYVSDDESALWRREYFKRAQLTERGEYPVAMKRIVVAIDPAVSDKPGSDETGIVVVGVGTDSNGYVLADESGRYRPEEWARRAVSAYYSFDADRIVAETNQGGDLVEATLRAQAPDVPYQPVRATGKGRKPGDRISAKVMRAEPVAALYERGKIFHLGEFPELEDQCCQVTSAFDPKSAGWSPDRVDALVWGFASLFPQLTVKQNRGGTIPAPPKLTIV